VASWGFVGTAKVSEFETGGDGAGSLDDFAHAAADRCGDAPSSIPVGAGVVGGEGIAEGEDGGDRWHDPGSQCGDAIVRRDTGEEYEEFLRRLAKESGIDTPTREQLAKLDRKRVQKGSNEWEGRGTSDVGQRRTPECGAGRDCSANKC